MATNMKNKVLHVIFDLDDGRWPSGRKLARPCMQVARGRDLVRPSVRLGMLRAGWPRSWGRLMQPSKEEASWTCTMSCAKQGVA